MYAGMWAPGAAGVDGLEWVVVMVAVLLDLARMRREVERGRAQRACARERPDAANRIILHVVDEH
jgi:hypothetical protein